MNRSSNIISLRALAALAGALAFFAFAAPVLAADPIFPIGSRIGIVPPAGMVESKRFPGFEDIAKDASLIFNVLPADAYAQIEKVPMPEALKQQGITVDKREPIEVAAGKGFLMTGRQIAEKAHYRKWLLVVVAGDITAMANMQAPEGDITYTDAVARAAFSTLAVRPSVPDSEALKLLPFKVGDLAGFQVEKVLPGRALWLVDVSDAKVNAHFWIAVQPGGPSEPGDRAEFARLAFGSIADIKDAHLTMSEPLPFQGQPGFQSMGDAKDARTDADIKIVQWLRFGGGGYLDMVGIARAETWIATLARLRIVRDSIDLK